MVAVEEADKIECAISTTLHPLVAVPLKELCCFGWLRLPHRARYRQNKDYEILISVFTDRPP